MKVAITKREEITGKDGREWVRYSGISKSGKAIKAFLPSDKDQFPIQATPKEDQVTAAFELLPIAEIDFDEDGRVEGVYEPE